jgi:hypothetical protein
MNTIERVKAAIQFTGPDRAPVMTTVSQKTVKELKDSPEVSCDH